MEAVRIEINDRRKVFAVRELFENAFPNLKLEFHSKPHTSHGAHAESLVVNKRLTIGDCRTVSNDGVLVIDPKMTTSELKQFMNDVFGLKAEIYRWSGSSWKVADSGKQSLEVFNQLSGTAL